MATRRAKRFKEGAFLHFRTDEDLIDDLDRLVEEARADGHTSATRSSIARTILRKGLGHDPTVAEVREVVANVHRATQMALNRITSDVVERLPSYLDEAAIELSGVQK